MNYPSLSLKQDLIDKVFSNKVFSNKNNGVQKELNQTASQSTRMKKYCQEEVREIERTRLDLS